MLNKKTEDVSASPVCFLDNKLNATNIQLE